MTRNQLLYWQNVETNRSNLAREQETVRSNLAQEKETNRSNLAQEKETNRHNVAVEFETNRHNLATENLTLMNLQQVADYNAKQASIAIQQLQEQHRANVAKEQLESQRNSISLISANAASKQADVAELNAGTNRMNATTNLLQAQEQARHNNMMEGLESWNLQLRSDVERNKLEYSYASLEESNRHNLEQENQQRLNWALQSQSNSIASSKQTEEKRANHVREQETKRANVAKESYNYFDSILRSLTSLATASQKSNSGLLLELLK